MRGFIIHPGRRMFDLPRRMQISIWIHSVGATRNISIAFGDYAPSLHFVSLVMDKEQAQKGKSELLVGI